jgi:hypothetical protein
LPKYLQEYRTAEGFGPYEQIPATLAFDATPVSSTGIGQSWSTGSSFAFILLPLDHSHKQLVIKSAWHKNGKINQEVRDLRDKLLEVLKGNGVLCHFVGTDGDNGVDGAHEKAFQRYAKLGTTNLALIVRALTANGQKDLIDWPVSDPLHLMKNARSREALGTLALTAKNPDVVTAKTLTENLPKEDKHVLQARRSLDLLKDDLAIQAFSLDNLVTVWSGGNPDNIPECATPEREGDPTGGYFLAPFVALSLALRNESLGVRARLDLVQVAFSFFFTTLTNYPECGKKAGITEKTVEGCRRKTFWTQAMCRRACNTCVGLYWAIQKYCTPEYHASGFQLSLNRIGSHSVECHFGMTRSVLNGDPRWIRFFSAQVKAVIVHRVMGKLGFHPYIRRFGMPAGCIVPPESTNLVGADFGNIQGSVDELLGYLSTQQHHIAYGCGHQLMLSFANLRSQLLHGDHVASIRESSPWSGAGMKNRMFTRAFKEEKPTIGEYTALRDIQDE